MPGTPKDEVVDFSDYDSKLSQTTAEEPVSALQPLPSNPITLTKRVWILVGVLILLALIQGVLYMLNRPRKIEVPDGYRIIQPINGPLRMEKIK